MVNGGSTIDRVNKDVYFMRIAKEVSRRRECPRRAVGAVIVDIRGRILSTGTNGVAPGQVSCIDRPCPGAKCKSGEGLDKCEASHAEISALVTLEKPFEAQEIFVTTEPCIACTKAILLTNIHRVVFLHPYPGSGMLLWQKAGRLWQQFGDIHDENTLQED